MCLVCMCDGEGVRMCSVMWEGVMNVVSGYVCVIESVSKKIFPPVTCLEMCVYFTPRYIATRLD